MIDDHTKRELRQCLKDNGFSAEVIDELIIERKTLRDEFAMHALQGIVSRPHSHPSDRAGEAYKYADKMLEARKK